MGKTRDESIKNEFLRYQANWLKGIICNNSRKTIRFYNIELLWRSSNQFSDYPPEIYLAMWNHNRRSQNIDISGYPQPFCSWQQVLNSVVPETSWPQSFPHVRLFSITRNAEICVYSGFWFLASNSHNSRDFFGWGKMLLNPVSILFPATSPVRKSGEILQRVCQGQRKWIAWVIATIQKHRSSDDVGDFWYQPIQFQG